jgi:acylphosphatase
MVQAHIFYSGTVQGVGFRFTVRRHAAALNLSGWVRNLPDGRVEVLAEGDKAVIGELMDAVENEFDGYISGKDVSFDAAAAAGTGPYFRIVP